MTIFIHRYNGKINDKEEFSYAVRQLDNLMGQIDAQEKLTDKLYDLLKKEEAKLRFMVEEAENFEDLIERYDPAYDIYFDAYHKP